MLRNVGWAFVGSVSSRGISMVAFMFITRSLGPEQYGLLSVVLAVITVITELSDLGIGPSAVRYGAQYVAADDQDRLSSLFTIALAARMLSGTVICGLGIAFAGPLCGQLLGRPEAASFLRLALVGIWGTLPGGPLVNILQAQQRFGHVAMVAVCNSVLYLLFVLVLRQTVGLTVYGVLGASILSTLATVIIPCFMVPRRLLLRRVWDRDVLSILLGYGKWMAVWSIMGLLQSQLSVFMLTRMSSAEDVGFYVAASRIASLALLAPFAYGTVLMPRLAAMEPSARLAREFRRSVGLAMLLAVGIVIFSRAAGWLVPAFTGDKYAASVPILQVLLVGTAIYSISLPSWALLSSMEDSRSLALAASLAVIVMFVANLVLIPTHRGMGAAVAYCLAQAAILVVYAATTAAARHRKAW